MSRRDPGRNSDHKAPKLLELFKNKSFLIIAGSILALLVVGGIFVFVLLNRADLQPPEIAADTETAFVLPQQVRIHESGSESSFWDNLGPRSDPFAEPMLLTGIVIGGRGGSMAIVESGNASYLVSEGDYVDDLWAVLQITPGTVTLRSHNQEVKLYLDQNPEIRSLDIEINAYDQGEGN